MQSEIIYLYIVIIIILFFRYFACLDCVDQGWSILVYAGQAELGDWVGAWENMQALNESVFYEAGGNGHSRSNCLWYVSTRPEFKKFTTIPTHLPTKLTTPGTGYPSYDWKQHVPTF